MPLSLKSVIYELKLTSSEVVTLKFNIRETLIVLDAQNFEPRLSLKEMYGNF